MELKEAISILENMCLRYGEPYQDGRTEEQVKEVIALNTILKEFKKKKGSDKDGGKQSNN